MININRDSYNNIYIYKGDVYFDFKLKNNNMKNSNIVLKSKNIFSNYYKSIKYMYKKVYVFKLFFYIISSLKNIMRNKYL